MQNNLSNKSFKVGPIIPFFGLELFGGSKNELLEYLRAQLSISRGKELSFLKIFTPNPEQIVFAVNDQEFLKTLQKGDIHLPDGAGLVWAIRRSPQFSVLSSQEKQNFKRIAGREVFHDLLEMAKEENWKVFLLGGKKGSAVKIIQNDQRSTINNQLDWFYDDGDKENTEEILGKIKDSKPDLLFVAYGAPWQEKWVIEHEDALRASGVKLAMVVGGAFEYESGQVHPVPAWMEAVHLEWLFRLLSEPWRWKRQLKGLQFFWWVLRGKFQSSNSKEQMNVK